MTPDQPKRGADMTDEKQSGPGDIPTGQRMKHVGAAMVSSMTHELSGNTQPDQKGAAYTLEQSEVEALIEEWPTGPRESARQMMKQYGPPNEGTPVRLIWYNNGPWKRTEVTSDEITHNFPAPHTDFISNWIDYHVPVERFADLARYDGSCLMDRTAGEAGARCDSEGANMVTLNLMHEIIVGKRTVEEAREKYSEQMAAYMLGRPAPYAERLLFDPPEGGTVDLDEATIAGEMAGQMGQKAKDMVAGEPGGSD
jgi:hypothetical protein